MNIVLQELQQSGIKHRIDGAFAAAIAYADAIVLLLPSLVGMQHVFRLRAELLINANLNFNINEHVTAACG